MMMTQIDNNLVFDDWLLAERDKSNSRSKKFVGDRPYRHFDSRIPIEALEGNVAKIAPVLKSKTLVAKHGFYPFIRKDQKVRLYRKNGIGQKVRPIMYASHKDACVFGMYSFLLKQRYEEAVNETGINDSVIAYRKIAKSSDTSKGKSNIDLAKDVFDLVRQYEKCAVLCIDVEKFFDRMNHELIKKKWSSMIGEKTLPNDHFAVYKNITQFRYIFLYDALKVLGYGWPKRGRFIFRKNSKKRGSLCTPSQFNILSAKRPDLIHKNKKGFGIPQGSPISDVIANVYLLDFDKKVLGMIENFEIAHYRRYSDDILIVCPSVDAKRAYDYVTKEIKKEKLNIKLIKTEVVELDFKKRTVVDITHDVTGLDEHQESLKQAFQFLGFEIDAADIHLRSGTIAAHYRRAKRRAARRNSGSKLIRKKTKKSRAKHWQYLRNAQTTLNSRRVNRQTRKVIKRAKGF